MINYSSFQRSIKSFLLPANAFNLPQTYTDQLLAALVTNTWQNYVLANPQVITFLQAPSENNSAVASLLGLLNPGTPGSDILLGDPSTNTILWGRSGNDTILGVDPGAAEPGGGKIDVLLGDAVPGETPGRDRFLLGDENKSYYSSQGFSDFALIQDFQTSFDKIRLRGTANDYRLVTFNSGNSAFPNGTALFLKKPLAGFPQITVPELVAIVYTDAPLNLNASYFEYDNAPPIQALNPQVRQIGTPGIDLSFGVATDNAGNAYLSGLTTGSLGGPNQGSYDGWIARYNSSGNQVWLRQIGTPEQDNLTRITTDNSGNVYVGGFTLGNLAGVNAGLEDAFLAKYDSNGNQIWARQFGSDALDNIFDVTVDNSNNVFATGFTIGDLGGSNASPLPVTDDSYIAKFDSNGNQIWLRQFGTTAFDEAYGVTTDSAGNVYATGWTQGDLGGPNAGLYDIWLVKYNTAGDRIWARQFGTSEYEFAWDIDVDSNNNLYVTGWTLGALGGSRFGSYDAWVAKYDSNGNQIWIKQFGTPGDDASFGIDVNQHGVFISGFTDNNFGGNSAGFEDAWYARLDFNGNLQSVKQFGTPDADRARGGIAVNNAGGVFVSGVTEGSLGGRNAGSYDAWLYRDQVTSSQLQSASQQAVDPVLGVSQTGSLLSSGGSDRLTQATNKNVSRNLAKITQTALSTKQSKPLSVLDLKNSFLPANFRSESLMAQDAFANRGLELAGGILSAGLGQMAY